METVTAFVPIKLNSQRVPGKNIKCFSDGIPLITLFLKTLIQVKEFSEVFVFCSNEIIKQFLIPGVRFLKRPEYLDTQDATPQDIMKEFISLINSDIYAVCHCTAPFVKSEHIGECVNAVLSGKFDSSFTGEKIRRLMWTEDREPLNFNPTQIPRTQDLPILYSEVSAAYVFKRSVFETYHRRVGINPHVVEVSGIECIDIDYPEDFVIANAVYTQIIKNMMPTNRGGGG